MAVATELYALRDPHTMEYAGITVPLAKVATADGGVKNLPQVAVTAKTIAEIDEWRKYLLKTDACFANAGEKARFPNGLEVVSVHPAALCSRSMRHHPLD